VVFSWGFRGEQICITAGGWSSWLVGRSSIRTNYWPSRLHCNFSPDEGERYHGGWVSWHRTAFLAHWKGRDTGRDRGVSPRIGRGCCTAFLAHRKGRGCCVTAVRERLGGWKRGEARQGEEIWQNANCTAFLAHWKGKREEVYVMRRYAQCKKSGVP
jgi:hypothetical protein